MPPDRVFRPDIHVRMRLQKLRNELIVYREIAVVKDNESEPWPLFRKDMIACRAVADRVDKETPSLEHLRRPGFLYKKLPLDRAHYIHPYMLFDYLGPIQNSIVA
jgi:hypothetical protein